MTRLCSNCGRWSASEDEEAVSSYKSRTRPPYSHIVRSTNYNTTAEIWGLVWASAAEPTTAVSRGVT